MPVRQTVHFTTYAPGSITPGSHFILDLWAHLSEQSGLVEAQARELGRERKVGVKAGVLIARDAILEASLELPGFELPDALEALVWTGEPANCSFPVRVPPQLAAGDYPGVIRLSIDGLSVARVHFSLPVSAAVPPAGVAQCGGGTVAIRSAFACYSSEDRDEVLGRVHGMLKVLPTLEVYLDVLELRSGQDWEKTIRPHIDSKDVFYLFWSAPAARSHEVEKEWRHAMRQRGLSYIDPVPLADPRDVPPPVELKQLHFNDRFLAHVEVHRRIKRDRGTRSWWKLFGG